MKRDSGYVYRLGQNKMSALHYAVLGNNPNAIYPLLNHRAIIDHQD